MNAAAIFTAAHAAAKIAATLESYRTRFATALRAAWAAAKQTIKSTMSTTRTTIIDELPATILLENAAGIFGYVYLEHLDRKRYFLFTADGVDTNARITKQVDGVNYRKNDYLTTDLSAASRQADVATAIAQVLRRYNFDETTANRLATLAA